MKRYISCAIICAMIISIIPIKPVDAINFKGQEEKYIKLCTSSQLNSSNKSTCEQFNTYLKNKNKDLVSQLKDQKTDANKTEDNIEGIEDKIKSIDESIKEKSAEIAYVEKSIENTQKEIDKSSNELKERMYIMQSYVNDNSFIDYIFGADSFVDMISRIDSYNQLVKSDNDLIDKLVKQKEDVVKQKQTLVDAKKVLDEQKSQQVSLQKKYETLLAKQREEILATQNAIYDYGEATESLSASIKKFNEEAYEVAVPQSKPVPPAPKPTTPAPAPTTPENNSNNSSSSNTSNNNSQNNESSNNNTQTPPSNQSSNNSNTSTDLGYTIYKNAASKLGCRYWWGASGPDYFDCSGFVYWTLNKSGVKVGRTNAASYARMFSSVSWSNSKTGDLACFGNGSVTHIGIVMLNADGTRSVIHAGGGDSSTHGDDPKACVKISSFQPGSYYYKRVITIRRVG